MKIETEMALVPLHESIQPVPSVKNRNLVDYGNYTRNRLKSAPIGTRVRRLGGNYSRFGENQKNQFSLGENVDIYV
jgi:hypothetical protein